MNKKVRKLVKKALCGNGAACRKLGQCMMKGKKCKRDEEMAKLILEKAIEMGDEKGYFIYCKYFLKGKQIIDDDSYKAICREYENTGDKKKKKQLEKYLELGTDRQRLWLLED